MEGERQAPRETPWADAPQAAATDIGSANLPAVVTQGRALVRSQDLLGIERPSPLRRLTLWLRNCLALEAAYGHGFLFWPLLIGLGALLWFSQANPSDLAQNASLACVLCMAAYGARYRYPLLQAVAFAAGLLAVGAAAAALQTWRLDTVLIDAPVTTTITGVVQGREVDARGFWRYEVALLGTRAPAIFRRPERVMLLSRGRGPPVAIGRQIEGRARLSPPSGPALRGANDFAYDAYFAGIGAVGYFYGTPRDFGPAPAQGLLRETLMRIAILREAVGTHIRGLVGGPTGALAAALVTGEERAIDPALVEAMRLSGLGHVLAISGLNMALAAGTLLVGLRTGLSLLPGFAQRHPVKKIAAAGALLMVTLYMMIAGGAVSAVRSFVMIVVMLLAVFVDRPSISLRNIALSGLLILLVTPSAITGPGFQMSFAATLALVALYRRLDQPAEGREASALPVLRLVSPVWTGFVGLVLSSLIGGLSTLIYSAAHFHRLPAYGLIANVLALPVVGTVVMPGALIAMLLMPFGLDGPAWMAVALGLDWMNAVARTVAGWGGEVDTGRLAPMAFALVAVGGVLLCLLRTALALSGLLLILAGAIVAVLAQPSRPAMLVSEDGRLVALLAGGTAAVNRTKPPDFIYDQWRRALVIETTAAPLMLPALSLAIKAAAGPEHPAAQAKRQTGDTSASTKARREPPPLDLAAADQRLVALLAAAPPGRFACVAREWCAAVSVEGWRIVTLEDLRLSQAACLGADLVIAPGALRERPLCQAGPAAAATGATLRRSGALEIRAGPAAEPSAGGKPALRVFASVPDLTAPWARHRLYDWRTRQFALAAPPDPAAQNHDENNQDNLAPADGFAYDSQVE
ncbi:hypothetical protein BTR14_00645 [Rhizobium rhizosphaerae]|uniref:ComEC family competence protein n=1 Tax=Xaviernesmea rhizosphaerae TaxID=1672749 RepID=A0ABX3PHR2_9HYPH|nr:ComEC/Rec2 family competence protein [Xaviernesmea rhizosphaerae]OQP88029.1 hypothetical protein BTR14_00645 [Xaviernesmea rhizosphaerae]